MILLVSFGVMFLLLGWWNRRPNPMLARWERAVLFASAACLLFGLWGAFR